MILQIRAHVIPPPDRASDVAFLPVETFLRCSTPAQLSHHLQQFLEDVRRVGVFDQGGSIAVTVSVAGPGATLQ